MCLAIPGEILEILDPEDLLRPARVAFGSMRKQVSLAYVPEAQIGDFVLVHVGFALTVLDAAEAERTLTALTELGALEENEIPD
ncbi:HypC/HybG/HupF family hydrogenase formation chaperone [bacterium (Candidatus Blackallbacteria) CG17_big_fil_post_rev_8_21_14_2_50_48_46]|uniref:HypC/HybG/HupF family hydrogenase formation chaperone n=1 Tax=bacterium (Candidatus Blackallbacteria) CG17_big_fil_post_rev_8_21_14_2_50_48_46 TaxID=2014261 RepID=A0A2M7GBB5_9BACT|nr:MAG: HypC/HybG/HupF family hydrogenase formation chaperone [bacterium (Candidatus Blackallbacteria) CG18_big_fil_WC_8_21_14_2_50_49_26]PIW19481.1 MAG: HypC/HybG/HupF family hydrogenase formation chaperone [bacterium (Candidatus Blackallbacteria) CG17_big_fil_post_rev_8_21_14_2_50_48_46]PIW48915.1 MAG: HypC/HybG/HupF family hydrogenase formation chaperone [bacterium (Candidatus Blackallbacteria) CG13_big_fil_rev_8_21_14_2_50_49_14]